MSSLPKCPECHTEMNRNHLKEASNFVKKATSVIGVGAIINASGRKPGFFAKRKMRQQMKAYEGKRYVCPECGHTT